MNNLNVDSAEGPTYLPLILLHFDLNFPQYYRIDTPTTIIERIEYLVYDHQELIESSKCSYQLTQVFSSAIPHGNTHLKIMHLEIYKMNYNPLLL
jgi:hypothetical protein